MLHQFLKPAILLFSITLPLWLVFRVIRAVIYKRRFHQTFSMQRELLLLLFYVYITAVITLTIIPIPLTQNKNPRLIHINYVPVYNTARQLIATIVHHKKNLTLLAIANILGNLVMFFPLGVFLPMAVCKLRYLTKVVVIAAAAAFAIELIQYISRAFGNYRSVDIDDIILNTTGAILGFIFWKLAIKPHTTKP